LQGWASLSRDYVQSAIGCMKTLWTIFLYHKKVAPSRSG